MGNNRDKFEVRVEVKTKGSMHYSSHVSMYIENTTMKMYHIDARTGEKAMQRAQKYGRPISAHKVSIEKLRGDIETLLSREVHSNPYLDGIAMDEFIWKKKNRRADRIENREKDKEGY